MNKPVIFLALVSCMVRGATAMGSATAMPAAQGDVIITEIMACPYPAVGLPAYEYVELFNRSISAIDLSGWTFTHNTTTVTIGAISIESGGFLILCSTTAAPQLASIGRSLGVKSFPTLTDKGAVVLIRDGYGNMVHGVEYSEKWHSPSLKSDGGWSLEMIDTGHPFYAGGNWRSSESRVGGTPGSANSIAGVNPDNEPLSIKNIVATDSLTLTISLNKSSVNFLTVTASYNSHGISIRAVTFNDPLQRSFTVSLSAAIKRGEIYSFILPSGARDFSGNGPSDEPFRFALFDTALPGDIRFNEILFNPWPEEYDFIELVNVSGRCIDASRLLLLSRNPSTGSESSAYSVCSESRCILPGDYVTITVDPQLLVTRFSGAVPTNIYPVSALPSMPDDKAIVFLYNRELDLIDRVDYDESMHFSLLSGTEGVSLEKVTPGADSGNRANWHSASATSGWATPGAANSVFTETVPEAAGIMLSGKKITPDSDGLDDVLVINFTSPSIGNVLNVIVFDDNGYQVKTLADNSNTGYEATFTWDGTADNGSMLSTGIYIIWVSAYDTSGNVNRWKKVCAIIRR